MPEIHLKQPGFTSTAFGSFTKKRERIQKFKETRDTQYIYKNELDKTCFQHDMLMNILKILQKKLLKLKVTQNMMEIKEVLFRWFINFSINIQQVVVLKVKLHKIG